MQETPTELVEAAKLSGVLAARKRSNLQQFLVTKAARYIERVIGTPLLIELPEAIKEFGLEAEEPLRIVKKLYDRGFILTPPRVSRYDARYPDEPKLYVTSFGKHSSGVDFFEPVKALWRALGEYLEREIWRSEDAWFRPNVRYGSASKFGTEAIDLKSIVGFSDAQRAKIPELCLKEGAEFGWMPVTSVSTGKTKLAPVQLFSSYYWHRERGTEPLLRSEVTTGLATGQSLEGAVLRGALEVLERDAFMITYLNKLSPPQIDLEHLAAQDAQIGSVLESFKRNKLEPYILLLPSDFAVSIVCVATIDHSGKGPALAVGAKADFSLREAILGALSESLAVRLFLRERAVLPDDFPNTKIGRNERLEYWMDLKRLPHVTFLFKGPLITPAVTKEVPADSKTQLARIAQMLRENHCDMYYAEVFSKKIRELTPLRTAYVMSPELQPLHLNEALPYLGGERLRSVPTKLGYPAASKLNSHPHPFP